MLFSTQVPASDSPALGPEMTLKEEELSQTWTCQLCQGQQQELGGLTPMTGHCLICQGLEVLTYKGR